MSPRAFTIDFIRHWEDGDVSDPDRTHSLDPVDNGNWTGGQQGLGKLVGSNHGITAAALGRHRSAPPTSITREAMRALTIDEATDIAIALYFEGPNISLLPWNRVTASVFDMGWGSGPGQAIKLLQRLIGAGDDGTIGAGGETMRLYAQWLGRRSKASGAGAYGEVRNAYYDTIIKQRPANAKYRQGWRNRTAYYLPSPRSASWWIRAT